MYYEIWKEKKLMQEFQKVKHKCLQAFHFLKCSAGFYSL